MAADTPLVNDIRSASRAMVRELGFMASTLAATPYSASAVHALLEIDAQGSTTAAQLAECLGLDKSSISRMVAKLINNGELQEQPCADDARAKQLLLTTQGQRRVAGIHAFGQTQVRSALAQLNPSLQQAVAQGLTAYAQALQAHRLGSTAGQTSSANAATSSIQIHSGYRPGLIGRVAEMHAVFYAKHWGFGAFFESQVASGIAEFSGRLGEPCNQVWTALHNDRIVGSVAIDGQDLGNNQAHLRWFILDDGCRGGGVGRQLLAQAMAFCDQRSFASTELWTFQGLDAARKLYESLGFALVHEEAGQQWGSTVVEQQFSRRLHGA
ncbi:DNA-binding MarR family transcriptional regulator/GNAT superfamily N-acetyltransferase [Comamonas sp. BIGb0152]|uniref:bifunctional helix-turn-helix transcriptional regulator/GNAT family N-acetyltransferase n=1 Tax=Comamonas sp. BIGb0152 TaxID=2940601 RepID=UPI002168748E|nr:helix-turn-helix domain-containing GNAT family N-acetyltransferase [Comamonas sp. BIGb0152]MCS4293624.1 DNA-binding MarR family transcriptional regulator/GNAT superfamily N-acetyltransferase [Comamonas sp. BIGb0152]